MKSIRNLGEPPSKWRCMCPSERLYLHMRKCRKCLFVYWFRRFRASTCLNFSENEWKMLRFDLIYTKHTHTWTNTDLDDCKWLFGCLSWIVTVMNYSPLPLSHPLSQIQIWVLCKWTKILGVQPKAHMFIYNNMLLVIIHQKCDPFQRYIHASVGSMVNGLWVHEYPFFSLTTVLAFICVLMMWDLKSAESLAIEVNSAGSYPSPTVALDYKCKHCRWI